MQWAAALSRVICPCLEERDWDVSIRTETSQRDSVTAWHVTCWLSWLLSQITHPMQWLHVTLGQELETLDMGAVIISVIIIPICNMINIMTLWCFQIQTQSSLLLAPFSSSPWLDMNELSRLWHEAWFSNCCQPLLFLGWVDLGLEK